MNLFYLIMYIPIFIAFTLKIWYNNVNNFFYFSRLMIPTERGEI